MEMDTEIGMYFWFFCIFCLWFVFFHINYFAGGFRVLDKEVLLFLFQRGFKMRICLLSLLKSIWLSNVLIHLF